ncbi:MAG: sensor histidine kinase [Myxococcota bacterium]
MTPRLRHSIRFRLTIAVGVMVGSLAIVLAVVAYVWFQSSLDQSLRDFGFHEIDEVAQVVGAATGIDSEARRALSRLLPEEGVLSLEVWSLEGERVYAHPASSAAAEWPEGLAAASGGREAVRTETGPNGAPALRVARLVRYAREPRWVAVAAVTDERAPQLIAQFQLYAAAAVGAVTLLAVGASFWVLGRALQPVRALVDEALVRVGRTDGGRLAEPRESELVELAALLNRMLAQTEESLALLRAFTANAGHELRTPLARIRADVEAALATPDGDASEVLSSVLEEVDSMRLLLDGLLDLARGYRALEGAPEEVDLVGLVEQVAVEAELVARERNVGVAVAEDGIASARVVGRRALLARVLWNLVNNALSAVSDGGRVELRVLELGSDRVAVEVEDDGPGVGSGDPERLFEPFVRGERRGDLPAAGFGLGLALGRAIARRHGGDLEWMPRGRLGGARLRLWLPVPPFGPDLSPSPPAPR